jgi:hypothetical protein
MATAKQFQVNTLSGGTLTTGLVSYWNMEGNSNDFYGSNNGTDTSVTYGTSYGKVNQGALFNGSNSMIALGSPSSKTAFSYVAWIKMTGNAPVSAAYIIALQGTQSLSLVANPSTNYLSALLYPAMSSNLNDNTSHNMNDSTWHFVVLTWSGTTLTLYRDGSNVGSSSISAANAGGGTGSIGVNGTGGNSTYFTGDIDEVGIWSKALSTNEISDLYNGGAGQTMLWGDTQSDSMMNADSRFATVAFTKRFVAALAATIMNAASRFTTLAGNLLILVRNVSVTMMNAASRLTMLAGTITKYVTALSVSMMNSASRLATLFGQQMQYIANLSVSMMNAVSRLVVLTTGNMKILVVNMMNAAGRFTTIYSQISLYIRNLTVNMMYAVNRLTSFLVTIPGTWAFRAKNPTSWAFRSKNNTPWTFRTKNPPGAENIPSEPN